MKTSVTRRSFLKGVASLPVLAVAGSHGTSFAAMVSPDDPTAKALEYTEQSQNPDQNCANCNLYQGGDAASGGCPIFPGKEVAAKGWCKSWVAKA